MTNIERFYRAVHGRDLQPWERQLAVRVAAALNTTTDDDFVVHLLLMYMSTNAITTMYNELVSTRERLGQDNRTLAQAMTGDLRRTTRMSYALLGVAVVSLLASVWILGSLLSLSRDHAATEARLAVALEACEQRAGGNPRGSALGH